MNNPEESVCLRACNTRCNGGYAIANANANNIEDHKSQHPYIWRFAAENRVRISYLPRGISRICQVPLSNRPGVYARLKTVPGCQHLQQRIPTRPHCV